MTAYTRVARLAFLFLFLLIIAPFSHAGIIGTLTVPGIGGGNPIFWGGTCSVCDAWDACDAEWNHQAAMGNGNILNACHLSGGPGLCYANVPPYINSCAPSITSPYWGPPTKWWAYFIATGGWSPDSDPCSQIAGCQPLNQGKDLGCNNDNADASVGNPCDAATGNKYQVENDYLDPGSSLVFTRYYNSKLTLDSGLGFGWTSPYTRQLTVNGTLMFVRRADGHREAFVKGAGVWTGDTDTKLMVAENASGYSFTLRNGATESYLLDGRLLSETSASGQTTAYGYDGNGRLSAITGPFSHNLTIGYDMPMQIRCGMSIQTDCGAPKRMTRSFNTLSKEYYRKAKLIY